MYCTIINYNIIYTIILSSIGHHKPITNSISGTSQRQPMCILHIGSGETDGEVKLFNENAGTWQKVMLSVKFRSAMSGKSKYNSVIKTLPNKPSENCGYHSSCYKNFTATAKLPAESTSVPSYTTRQQVVSPKSSSSGVLEKKCIFCNQVRKKVKGKYQNLTKNASSETEFLIRDAMLQLDDNTLGLRIGNYKYGEGADFVALEVHYHNFCKQEYLNRAKAAKPKMEKSKREDAFTFVINYVKGSVLEENMPVLASDLLAMYVDFFMLQGGNKDELLHYTVQNMCKKLSTHFPTEVSIEAEKTKKTVIWKTGAYSYAEALKMAEGSNSTTLLVEKCALKLRNEILALSKDTIEDPVTTEKILDGEVNIPSLVKAFYTTFYTGGEEIISAKKKRLIESSSADAVFSCSSGKLLPGKHLSLAFVVKSMTGSRGVVTLLNKLGHCASNETTRRIDMGLERTLLNDNSFLPSELTLAPNLSLSFAWDNFDIQLETPSGHDTIHHTYGICYQNKPVIDEELPANAEQQERVPKDGKRKVERFVKVCNVDQAEVEPYHKKPRLTKFSFEKTPLFGPEVLGVYGSLDMAWKWCFNLSSTTPMWTGWNARRFPYTGPKQKVMYMKHIPLPSTRDDVIKETMARSLQIANACGENFAIVSYDLLMAKQAKKIQVEETPLFDNLFIQFGQFHTMQFMLGSLSRIIEGSGGPYVLMEGGIVAPGSMNKFLKGKMFNRCRRGYQKLALSLEGLHLKQFFLDLSVKSEDVNELLQWSEKSSDTDIPSSVLQLMAQYDFYVDETLQGERGKTAQFWMSYIKFTDLFFLLQRAVKTNNVELYGFVLHEVCALFFVTNHQNYARWMSLYSLELTNLRDQSPEVFEALSNGAFSVNRTGNPFANVGTDMALEQTINAHAKNRLKGIMQFADVSSAVNRWLVTSSMKTKLTNALQEYTGMKQENEQSKELRPALVAKSHEDVTNLKTALSQTLNPFAADVNKNVLFNIKTGRAASVQVEDYLLNIVRNGSESRDKFIEECLEDADRFEKSITKFKIHNFATECFTMKNKSRKASEIAAVKGTRDLFARMVYLAVTNKISISLLLEYPLLPVPPCFTHADGSIYQSNKSVIFTELVEGSEAHSPKVTETVIVDGMHLIRSLKPMPATFSGIAMKILTTSLKLTSHRCDLCFDEYTSPNIKDVKRKERGDVETASIFNFGPLQKTPSDIKNLLLLSEFKKELLSFLRGELQDQRYAPVIGEKVLYLSIENGCMRITSVDGSLRVEDVPELFGAHMEADTRVMLHARHADINDPGNIVVRANDTDVAIVLLANVHVLNLSQLWYDSGLDGNNTRKYTSITKLAASIPYNSALPGLYAFTGCDYTPFFFGKGKVAPLQKMIENDIFINAFSQLGSSPLTQEMFDLLEEFTCCMYGYPKKKKINDARVAHFDKKCKPRETAKPFDAIKSVDPQTFMPCQRVLNEQIKRAWYIAHVYKSAADQYPGIDHTPMDFGWVLTNDKEHYDIKWFEGEQTPTELEEIAGNADEIEVDEDVERESDRESDSESDEFESDEDD